MMCRVFITLLCLMSSLGGAGSYVAASELEETRAFPKVQFRRMLVPADRREDWPIGQQKHLPMAPDEFERLLAASADSAVDPDRPGAAPRLVRAEYEARLDGDRMTAGRGTLWVEHSSEARALLRLDPCGLAIHKAVWGDDDSRPAVMGKGTDGRLGLLVDQSGRLEIEWSLAGKPDTAGGLAFSLQLPAAPVNRLFLQASDDVAISVDRGVVLHDGDADEGMRRWQIELGNHYQAELQVAPSETGTSHQGLAMVRERTSYEYSLRGVEVSSEWNLEIHHEPLGTIDIRLDEPLQLVEAKLGEEEVPWSEAAGDDGEPPWVTLHLPTPLQGTGLALRLVALAPLDTGTSRKLPRIRPVDIFWQEGRATLSVRAPLVVKRFTTIGCRQTDISPLTPPLQGEMLQLQLFRPEATAEFDIVDHTDRAEVVSGTSVRWTEEEIRAEVQANFRLHTGTQFQLAGTLRPGWIVDAVETLPANALDQWAVEPDNQGGHRLVVELAQPLTGRQSVRLSVRARRFGSPAGQAFAFQELLPLRFEGETPSGRLVGLRIPDAYELEPIGDSPPQAQSLESLQSSERELLSEDDFLAIFILDDTSWNRQAQLTPRRPRFATQIDVETWLSQTELKERYRLRCEPESARLDRLIVHMSRHREEPLEWVAGGDNAVRVSSRRWSAEEQSAAGLTSDGEVWELRLNPPVSEALEVTAGRRSAISGEASLSLASVPDAEVQTGFLAVHAMPGTALDIDNRRLRQVTPEPVPSDHYATARATFRYDPWREVGSTGEPSVVVSASGEKQPALAVIWEARLDSRFDAGGIGSHVAVFHLENLGQHVLRVHLPVEMRDRGPVEVWVDGQRVAAGDAAEEDRAGSQRLEHRQPPVVTIPRNELHIALPPDRKYPTVTIVFTSWHRPLLPLGALRAPWPEPAVEVVNRSWSAWLPPDYATYGSQGESALPVAPIHNWRERLLGPLGRPAGEPSFDPFDAGHWLSVVGGGVYDRREAVQQVERWLSQAAVAVAGSDTAPPKTSFDLGSIVVHESASGLRDKVLVDRDALARHGFTPKHRVAAADPTASELAARHLLTQSSLSLLICDDAVLLTTQADAARLRPHLASTSHAHVWWVRSQPLGRRLAHAARLATDPIFVPATSWVLDPEQPPGPWIRGPLPGWQPADQLGWHGVTLLGGEGRFVVRYRHTHSVRLAGAIAFLLTVSAGWWFARRRPLTLLGAAAIAGLAGLWLPEPYVPTASGIVLGALFCLAFRLVHRRLRRRAQPPRAATVSLPSTISAAVPWGLVLLVSTTTTVTAQIARGDNPGTQAESPMYRVVVPVDDEKQPVGGKYYLPEPLFEHLHRLAASRRDLPQGWLLGEAVYRGELVRESVGERLLINQIRAQFDLHVFSPSAQVRIPLQRTTANLLPDGVLLDGRVVQVEWSADNRGLVVEVAEPGQYQIELRMRPRMAEEPSNGFDLSIPPLPTAQFELTLPSGAPAIDIPSARGEIRREESPSRVVAKLGPSDLLSVRWPPAGGLAGNVPAVDIEELLCINVQPGAVLVDAKWRLTVVEGRVRQLRLATDPRLRLLPFEGERSPGVRTLPSENGLAHLILEWPEPLQDEMVVSARFLLTGTSGVGKLRIPQLEILDGRITRRWMAVSVDDALQFEQSGAERLALVPLPEFLSAWGTMDDSPRFAYRLPARTPDWTLATQPREPNTSSKNALSLRFAEHATEVDFQATLVTSSGYVFRYRIAVPETFEPKQVALLSDGVDRTVRWSQDNEGVINLFLAGPVSGEQQLLLQGRLPANLGQTISMPSFHIENTQHIGTTFHLMRQSGIRVEVAGRDSLAPAEAPAMGNSEPPVWLGAGSYHMADVSDSSATITADLNQPKVTGKEILRLSVIDGEWHARWECQLDIHDGFLEELTVAGPANWGNRFRTSDDLQWSVRSTEGARQEFSARPRQPAQGQWWAWVSGRLQLRPGEPVAVPDVSMHGNDAVSRFLILPRRIEDRATNWHIQGLQPVPLDRVVPELAPEYSALAAFRVVGKPFSAQLPDLPARADEGRVHLAEYAIAWQDGTLLKGSARFDVIPGARSDCTILFPENTRPLLIKVDEVPAQLAGGSDSTTRTIQLGPPGVPQRVEVVFATDMRRSVGDTLELEAPRVLEMPVEKTLWAFATPAGRFPTRLHGADEAEATAWEIALARMERLGALLERFATATNDNSRDTLRWYRRWLTLWVDARTAALAETNRLSAELDRLAALEHIQQRTNLQRDIAAGLDAEGALDELLAAADRKEFAIDTWHAQFLPGRLAVYRMATAGAPAMTLHLAPLPGSSVRDRIVASAGWIVLLGILALGVQRGLLFEWFRRWPQTVGAMVGLAWWLWLTPSGLGLVLVLVCLATSLRAAWRSLFGTAPNAPEVVSHSCPTHRKRLESYKSSMGWPRTGP